MGGVSVIPCKVNGLKLNFIFDTGASDVTISMTEATFMLKNGYLSKEDLLGSKEYLDAIGNISTGIVINLKLIEIAGYKLYNVKAAVVQNNKAPLLLGQSAIEKLGKFQLDLAANTLTLFSGNKAYDFSNSNVPSSQQSSTKSAPKGNNTILIENLEVAESDFQTPMNWEEAKRACEALGKGWHLPNKDELDVLFKNKNMIEGLDRSSYWSSSEYQFFSAWFQNFVSGKQEYSLRGNLHYVRAVRARGL